MCDSKFNNYMKRVGHNMTVNRAWRYGQTLFNTLDEMYPDIANRLRTTELDPYYHRGNIGFDDFYKYIEKEMEDKDGL